MNAQPQALQPQAETGYSLLAVPAGRSTIELRYEESSAERAGGWLSVAAIAILLGTALIWRGSAHTASAPVYLSAGAGGVWIIALLIALAVKTWWLRRNATCAATYGVQTQVDIRFTETFRLCGFRLSSRDLNAGDALELTLYWEVQQRDGSPSVFVHMFGDAPDLSTAPKIGQHNGPILGGLPSVEWTVGKLYRETITLQTPLDSPPGDYLLEVGVWDAGSGQRFAPIAQPLPEGVVMSPFSSVMIRGLRAEAIGQPSRR